MTINALILNYNPYVHYAPKDDQHGCRALDRDLRRLWSRGYITQVFKQYIAYQFNFIFEPAYFGTICWTPFIYEFDQIVNESNHFKNKLLAGIYDCKLYQVPDLPIRPRIIFFHEIKEILINPNSPSPKFKRALHTHFHLEGSGLILDANHLNTIIQTKVRPNFDRLKRRDTDLHKAVVIENWDRGFHAHYNDKDYYLNWNRQDRDLVLDYKNSDLS